MLLYVMSEIIVIVYSCQIENKERNYYLNEGEYFLLYLEQVFKEENQTYICKGCDDDFQLNNTITSLGTQQINEHQFLSLSSNQTNFLLLTDDQNLIIYQNGEQKLEIVETIKLNKSQYCLNAVYTITNSILMDCYDESQLYINEVFNDQINTLYNDTQNKPDSSKLQQFISNQTIYILYAQYYQEYSILTLFSQQQKQYINQTTWTYGLNDFIATSSLLNQGFIYILVNNIVLFQVSINEQNQFYYLEFFYQQQRIFAYQVYRSFKFNSQCDQLIIFIDNRHSLLHFQACEGNFVLYRNYQLDFKANNNTYYKIFINDDFFILQQNHSISISSTTNPEFIYFQQKKQFEKIINLNTLFYFNTFSNQLFEFSEIIQQFQISYPQLSGYYYEKNFTQIISIYAIDQFLQDQDFCVFILNFFTVESNDTSIYLQNEYKSLNQYQILNASFYDQLSGYVGPLIYYEGNIDSNVGSFSNQTLKQSTIEIEKEFDLAQLFYIASLPKQHCLFLTGLKNTMIQFQLCCKSDSCSKQNYQLNDSQEILSIQTAYNIDQELLVVMNSDLNNLLIFTVSNYKNSFSPEQKLIPVTQFTLYVVSYNCIILLTDEQNIEIITLDGEITYYFNRTNYESLFPSLSEFTPEGILLNTQYQSSILIINNINEVLLLRITDQQQLLPIGFIYFDFQIKQIQLVMNYLILLHICSDIGYVCIDVWDISNPYKPYFMKKIRSILFDEIQAIFSDNLFFYIQTKDNYLFVYNPLLSQHQSPWKSFKYDNSYFTSTYAEGFSYILSQSFFSELFPTSVMKFIPNYTYMQMTYLSSFNYNFTILTELNSSSMQTTKNLSLNIINSYTNIFLQDTQLSIGQRSEINITSNQINLNSQVFDYKLQDLNPNKTKNECHCSIQNSIILNYNVTYDDEFNIAIAVDNFFILQNERKAQVINGMMLPYKNIYFNCLKSTSFQNNLYTICVNPKSTLILQFQIQSDGNLTEISELQLPIYINGVDLFETLLSLFFIIGLNPLNSINLYLFNPNNPNNSYYISDCEKCNYFAVTNFQNSTDYAMLAVFYTCQNKIYYKIGIFEFSSSIITFDQEPKRLQLATTFKQTFDYPINIQIIKAFDFEIIALITTTDFCSTIVSMIYSQYQKQFFIQQYFTTIPPFGNFWLLNSDYKNDVIMLIYGMQKEPTSQNFVYAFYQIKDFKQFSIQKPMQMMGAIYYSEYQLTALISQKNGSNTQILFFRNNSGSIYNLSTFQINCKTQISLFVRQRTFTYQIIAQNYYFSNQSLLTLTYERNSEIYFYFLAIIVLLCFLCCIVYFQQKNSEQIDSYSNIFQEFEL